MSHQWSLGAPNRSLALRSLCCALLSLLSACSDAAVGALRLRDAIGDWMESTQRDRGTRLEGDGTYEFLRGLGYVGGD